MRRRFVAACMLALASAAPARTIYVHAGRLIEPATGSVSADRMITVTDGRVAAIGAWSPPPSGGEVVDWSRYTVLPGLIDCHTHIADGYADSTNPVDPLTHTAAETVLKGAEAARTTLRAGFTTVRDVGVYRGLTDVALRDAIEAGEVEGPRMLVAGAYITIPGGGGAVTGASPDVPIPPDMRYGEVRDATDAREKVRWLFQHRVDFIKLIASGAVLALGSEPGQVELSPGEMQAACDQAAAAGSYCIAHAHGAASIKAAIRTGARSIEHASLIDDEGIALAKARGVWLDMDIYNGDWINDEGVRKGWPAEYIRKNVETTEAQRENFRKALKAGVKLSFGTDAGVYPHGLNARQLAYMVRYGMSPMQAIQAATTVAAALLRRERDIGSLTPGHYGDMVAVSGDPLSDVRTLEHAVGVLKGGEVVR